MAEQAQAAIRRMTAQARVGRPPIRDSRVVAKAFARLLEERLRDRLQLGRLVVTPGLSVVRKLSEAVDLNEGDDASEDRLLGLIAMREVPLGGIVALGARIVDKFVSATTGAAIEGVVDDGVSRPISVIDEALCAPFIGDLIDCFERSVSVAPGWPGRGAMRFARFARAPKPILNAVGDLDVLTLRLDIGFAPDGEPLSVEFNAPLASLDVYKAAEAATSVARAAKIEAASDSLWSAAMLQAAGGAEVRLVAVLREAPVTLGELSEFQPGHVLKLPLGMRMEVELRLDGPEGVSEAPTIGAGALGAAQGYKAVRLDDALHADFTKYLDVLDDTVSC